MPALPRLIKDVATTPNEQAASIIAISRTKVVGDRGRCLYGTLVRGVLGARQQDPKLVTPVLGLLCTVFKKKNGRRRRRPLHFPSRGIEGNANLCRSWPDGPPRLAQLAC